MQGTDPKWLQISACAKHFAVHSWNTPSTYMAYPTKQDLADTYLPGMTMAASVEMKSFASDACDRFNIFSCLPAFEAAVKAGISGFMCS